MDSSLVKWMTHRIVNQQYNQKNKQQFCNIFHFSYKGSKQFRCPIDFKICETIQKI